MTKETKESKENKALSLKTLTKSSVWDIQENDIFRMLSAAEKDSELKDNLRHYASIIRSAFQIEELKEDENTYPLCQIHQVRFQGWYHQVRR